MKGCLLIALFALARDVQAGTTWPVVAEQDVLVGISTPASRKEVSFVIRGVDGLPLYRFSCRGGNEQFLDRLYGESGIVYAPDFTCLLNEGVVDREGSLLAEGGEPPWFTRGQFHWSELAGRCGTYPEYGRVRHFRLRGMELTLAVTDVQTAGDKINYFVFQVSVKRMPEADSAHAVSSGYLRPTEGCETIRKGVEPTMCRDSKGDWQDCGKARAR